MSNGQRWQATKISHAGQDEENRANIGEWMYEHASEMCSVPQATQKAVVNLL